MTPHSSIRRAGTSRRAGALLVVLLFGAAVVLGACGDDESADTTTSSSPTAVVPGDGNGETEAGIVIADAWARTSPMNAMNGAAYMVITNDGDADDALLSASVPADVAGTAEVHETRAAGGDDGMGSGDMGGEDTDDGMGSGDTDDEGMGGGSDSDAPMMEMVEVDRIDVPAGATTALEPGGFHIMLLDLVEPLADGDVVTLTLTFEKAGEITVDAVVGSGAP